MEEEGNKRKNEEENNSHKRNFVEIDEDIELDKKIVFEIDEDEDVDPERFSVEMENDEDVDNERFIVKRDNDDDDSRKENDKFDGSFDHLIEYKELLEDLPEDDDDNVTIKGYIKDHYFKCTEDKFQDVKNCECHCYWQTGTKHHNFVLPCKKHMICLVCTRQLFRSGLLETVRKENGNTDLKNQEELFVRPPPSRIIMDDFDDYCEEHENQMPEILEEDVPGDLSHYYGYAYVEPRNLAGLYLYCARHHLPVNRLIITKSTLNDLEKIGFIELWFY